MKILNIRFKNLNSLVGAWEIDLTHPAYTLDGIFAITGPTGAGKSTILDAICLALYGRTPRLEKVTKSGNEIMSRLTAECFAEVTFETRSGRFCCHWSQRRARKKFSGELQTPKHEVSDANSKKILQSSLRTVAEYIEKSTGMNFERFTRSMLLAQGGFDVFLKASPSDRSPILEQLTGTEVYSHISKAVHERYVDEGKKLATFQIKLDGISLLSEEDERELEANLKKNTPQENNLSLKVEKTKKAISWLNDIANLEKDLEIIDEENKHFLVRQSTFKPEIEKLEKAKRALELAAEFTRFDLMRKNQEADFHILSEYRLALPNKETEVLKAKNTAESTSESLLQKKKQLNETVLLTRKVRGLDFKLEEKLSLINKWENAIKSDEKLISTIRTKYNEDTHELGHKEDLLKNTLIMLSKHEKDETLIEHLSGIRNRVEALQETETKRHEQCYKLSTAENIKNKAHKQWKKTHKHLEKVKTEFQLRKDELIQLQKKFDQKLSGKSVTDWRNELSKAGNIKTAIDNINESIKSLLELERTLNETNKRHDVLSIQKTSLTNQIQEKTDKQKKLEKNISQLETQIFRINRIQDLDEYRKQLQDGEHCPLCGATDHPFAKGNIPEAEETTETLDQIKNNFKKGSELLSSLKIKQAETIKDLTQTSDLKKDITTKIALENTRIQSNSVILSIETHDRPLNSILSRIKKENDDKLGRASKLIQEAEEYDKAIDTMRASLDKIRNITAQAELETQTAAHKKDSTLQEINRIKKEFTELEASLQKSYEILSLELLPYGIKSLSSSELQTILSDLSTRRDRRVFQQKNKIELEKQVSTLALHTQHQAEQVSQLKRKLKKQLDELTTFTSEQDQLNRERTSLFGDKNPDTEESNLSSLIDKTEKDLEHSRHALHLANHQLEQLKADIESFDKKIGLRAKTLKSEETIFQARLIQLSFSDEADFQAACLPEDERQQLAHQAQLLAAEQAALHTKHQEKSFQLKIEYQKQMTNQSGKDLLLTLNELLICQKELQEQLIGIQLKLKHNNDLKCEHQAHTNALDAQKREYSHWDMLHELIGSADGKKYRNFAQGLTFEMMVRHANQQLQKMSDRYLLIRDDKQPLELNVIDDYQAGEIRSTKNLSGGERFIISLSLALGLSHMASKNVQVDSLFLDEGFGSLDDNALDTALETLAGLQKEGKLIGVISHVSALKERINAQIEVIPCTGGRSTISGPGCGKLTQESQT